jgi:uncharacterized membrane protein YfcA
MDLLQNIEIYTHGFSLTQLIILAFIFAGSGFISGLTGFGFGLFGIFSLWILAPKQAIPLLMALSLANQTLSLSQLRHTMMPMRQWWPHGPAPFILGGLFGIPVGLFLLLTLNPFALDETIGSIMLVYATWMVFKGQKPLLPATNTLINTTFGFLGGIIGGLVAVPGPIVVVWATMAGLTKDAQRAIVQPFILSMQIVAITEYTLKGPGLDASFFLLFVLMVPGMLLATRAGVWTFQKIQDHHFQKAVMLILGLSGLSLIYKGKMFWGDFLLSHHFAHML